MIKNVADAMVVIGELTKERDDTRFNFDSAKSERNGAYRECAGLKSDLTKAMAVVEAAKKLGEVVAKQHLRYPDWWPNSKQPEVIQGIFDALTAMDEKEEMNESIR